MGRAPENAFKGALSRKREQALVEAGARGDQPARDQLVEAFLPLIGSVARAYSRAPGVDRAEVMQAGVAGLLEAIGRFDPVVGAPFWAYASWWVRQSMQRLIAEVSRPIVLSDPASRKLASIRDARARLNRAGNQDPTREQLMTETGLTRQHVEGLLAAEASSRGLDEPAAGDEGPTLQETIADPVAEHEYDRMDDDGEAGLVRRMAAGLGDRERTIVYSRFGIGGPVKTLREVGEVLDLSAERVRQIEEQALTKLRSAFETEVASSHSRGW